MKKIGLGIQELSVFRERNLIYVDKTEIIHKLVNCGKYYFLSRPRRFGKSLLVKTFQIPHPLLHRFRRNRLQTICPRKL